MNSFSDFGLADVAGLLQSSGCALFVRGSLYGPAQVIHPRCARFSLQNNSGLFFVKVFQAELVTLATGFEPGTELGLVGEMHSFVNRRCKNHHVFIKASALFVISETQ